MKYQEIGLHSAVKHTASLESLLDRYQDLLTTPKGLGKRESLWQASIWFQ